MNTTSLSSIVYLRSSLVFVRIRLNVKLAYNQIIVGLQNLACPPSSLLYQTLLPLSLPRSPNSGTGTVRVGLNPNRTRSRDDFHACGQRETEPDSLALCLQTFAVLCCFDGSPLVRRKCLIRPITRIPPWLLAYARFVVTTNGTRGRIGVPFLIA